MKIPLTPAGIEPATFRFVAQHLNHCATAVPCRNEDCALKQKKILRCKLLRPECCNEAWRIAQAGIGYSGGRVWNNDGCMRNVSELFQDKHPIRHEKCTCFWSWSLSPNAMTLVGSVCAWDGFWFQSLPLYVQYFGPKMNVVQCGKDLKNVYYGNKKKPHMQLNKKAYCFTV